ncbi:hypothetical protein EXIGLDRAFT_700435 [Exidia glandulosa HHB12029]|uniref:Ribonuclease H1 N-terminal domain-containing protein n=1 Tax=Exidia glandulosa HHB12029 TaxID=1314781 RepID=A0A165DFX6_EXIGL|nr:hypothetical protein EXIGLDRAFT_700435 [Exidia glandulosa HHB12029]
MRLRPRASPAKVAITRWERATRSALTQPGTTQVKGFPKLVHKKFKTLHEAEAFIAARGVSTGASTSSSHVVLHVSTGPSGASHQRQWRALALAVILSSHPRTSSAYSATSNFPALEKAKAIDQEQALLRIRYAYWEMKAPGCKFRSTSFLAWKIKNSERTRAAWTYNSYRGLTIRSVDCDNSSPLVSSLFAFPYLLRTDLTCVYPRTSKSTPTQTMEMEMCETSTRIVLDPPSHLK